MEEEQTPKQVQPEDTETIQIEERDAKQEFNSARGIFGEANTLLHIEGHTHTS